MADNRYNPDSLADHLDEILPPGSTAVPAPGGDPLVDAAVRLAGAPQPPPLDPAFRARLRQQTLDAFRQQLPHPTPRTRIPSPAQIALSAALIIVTIVVVLIVRETTEPRMISPQTTEAPPIILPEPPLPALVPEQTEEPEATEPVLVIVPVLTEEPEATEPVLVVIPEQTEEPEATTEAAPDLPVTFAIEGPVEAVDDHIITIFGIEIELAPDDPLLAAIQPGDTLRVEGVFTEEGTGSAIVAVDIVFAEVDVVVSEEGEVWRDSGNCQNPPPPWAPANGWRLRCEREAQGGDNPGQNRRSANASENPGQSQRSANANANVSASNNGKSENNKGQSKKD